MCLTQASDCADARLPTAGQICLAVLATVVALFSEIAAGQSPSGAAAEADPARGRFFVYVAVGEENKIAIFNMDPATGRLDSSGSAPLDGAPGSLGVDPDQRFLYAAIRSRGSVTTLRVHPSTGQLEPLGSVPVAGNPVYVVPDRSGNYLLTAYYSGDKAAVYPIESGGTVGREPTALVATDKNPHSILADPTNRFVYVPNTGADKILQYRFHSQSGLLEPLPVPAVMTEPGLGPRHFVFHPDRNKNLVYVVNEKNSSVTVFERSPTTGALTAFQNVSTLPADFQGNNTCADIEITPSGKFVYASNRGHDSLACFAVDESTGKLKSLGQQPTEKTPREFAIDPTGNYLYAAGQASGRLASYRIDQATGKLRPLEVYPVGKGPAWVLVLKQRVQKDGIQKTERENAEDRSESLPGSGF